MPNVSYEILKKQQKMYIKAYAILCLLVAVGVGFFTYKKWEEYTFAKAGVEKNQTLISVLNENLNQESSNYSNNRKNASALYKEMDDKLVSIFPAQDNYTALTRQLDGYEETLSKKNNPFEVSNIDYETPLVTDTYSVLPLTMNIRSSRENFTKFLHMVENSGALDEDIRLMDISSIRLNFEESISEDETEVNLINFTVQINAYFQKQS